MALIQDNNYVFSAGQSSATIRRFSSTAAEGGGALTQRMRAPVHMWNPLIVYWKKKQTTSGACCHTDLTSIKPLGGGARPHRWPDWHKKTNSSHSRVIYNHQLFYFACLWIAAQVKQHANSSKLQNNFLHQRVFQTWTRLKWHNYLYVMYVYLFLL